MKNPFIKMASVSLETALGNVMENVRQIKQSLQETDAKLVVFPELSLTGYSLGDLFHQDGLLKEVIFGLEELRVFSQSYPQQLIVVGAPLMKENRLYNTAVFIQDGEYKLVVPKTFLPNYHEFYELRWFASGMDVDCDFIMIGKEEVAFGKHYLLKDGEIKIGCEICEDLWVVNRPSNVLVENGANVIVNLSASNEMIGKAKYRRHLVLQQSAIGHCAYIYASSGLGESSTDLVFSGHCMIAGEGHLLKEMIWPLKRTILEAIVDMDKIIASRRSLNTFGNGLLFPSIEVDLGQVEESVEEMVSFLHENHYDVNPFPFVPREKKERIERSRAVLQMQSRALFQRYKATGLKTAVIGVSGGLDSTLALLVLHETRKLYPDLRMIGVTMPSYGNTTNYTYQNALDLMEALNIEVREIPIQEMVQEHLKAIGHPTSYQGEGDTTYENAQARMRTYLLMDIANQEKGLVIGTGDLSELALGWCTYNGDHMSMYGVNSSIPKTLVKYICESYALETENKALSDVLHRIVNIPISPELTPNQNGEIVQKTEEVIGKYDLNDFFLYHMIRFGSSVKKLVTLAMVAYPSQSKKEIKLALERFLKRFFSQQFKRSCLPDGPKVGTISLSPRGDWRMPSDVSGEVWLKELNCL
ncbi:NAD(+) synthase [Bulleidia sp. zg-1006]|uniref:NAD(+) synthase n=1 Tax=Bulleidia sp. zg-1006 TaxID=2806552 RepID=UPI00193AB2DB|nr:NAD(+) synthase [Bulleidia sp. zg-1006]QRG87230.1 NAD(+) synthase [Bulleidia sp. zg-1006]